MPLFTSDASAIPPVTNLDFSIPPPPPPGVKYMCADDALIGIGMLSDHCLKTHGWWEGDYDTVCNLGRGKLLWDFRNFCMENLGLGHMGRDVEKFRVLFSIQSSGDRRRNLHFQSQITGLRDFLKKHHLEVSMRAEVPYVSLIGSRCEQVAVKIAGQYDY